MYYLFVKDAEEKENMKRNANIMRVTDIKRKDRMKFRKIRQAMQGNPKPGNAIVSISKLLEKQNVMSAIIEKYTNNKREYFRGSKGIDVS